VQDTSLRFRFQSEYLGFYCYLEIRKDAMCQFSTSDKSFQNHLAGIRVTVKLALQAGPSGKLFQLAINVSDILHFLFSILCTAYVYSGSLSYYGSHRSAQQISLRICFQSEFLSF
jgi:hypothetical protein